eukprot:COSAG02_NODE_928_length_15853_cov_9.053574_8_plen_123_part_00
MLRCGWGCLLLACQVVARGCLCLLFSFAVENSSAARRERGREWAARRLSAAIRCSSGMSAMEIDEDAQSRQLAVYGREALLTLGTAKVLISGLNGLGVEIGAPSKPNPLLRAPWLCAAVGCC